MTKICSKCKKPAITFIRYNGTHLCKNHFIQYLERRVKRDIKKQGKTPDKSRIGIALSGGKDSTVTLHLINNIFSKRPNIELHAIIVDEGIKNYRDKSIQFAVKNCKKLGIEHHIISFKQSIGKTLDEIAALQDRDLHECSYCGVFRRACLNKKAKELHIDKLATGHNLDDVAQSILMNFVNGDIQKLIRLGPHKKIHPGLIPRILPLRTIPEKEVMLYAFIQEIDFYNGECPYAVDASRGIYREIIDKLEYINPGTRHSILSTYENIKDVLTQKYPSVELNQCKKCGEPTSQETCKTCFLLERIRRINR